MIPNIYGLMNIIYISFSTFSNVTGYVGKHNLLPLYDYLVTQIRKVDKKKLIFYEPVTYGVFFPALIGSLGTGFDRVPGALTDSSAASKSVLSYHYYCWVASDNPGQDMPRWKRTVCDEVHSLVLDKLRKEHFYVLKCVLLHHFKIYGFISLT